MNPSALLDHFDRISDAPDAIPRLRRFVRDLAVRGKLVEQDARDGPASRELHCEVGEDAPYQVPAAWTWARVGDVAECRLGKMLDKAKNRGTPRRYLRNVNVRWFDFELSDVFEMRFEDSELEEFALRRGDILICEGGEPGRAAVWDQREDDVYFQKAIHRVRFANGVDPHFFVNFLKTSADSGNLNTYFTGVGIKHFTGRSLALFLFPVPPLGEQHRIVAKLDELMALCDQLEAAQAERERRRDKLSAASMQRLNAPSDAHAFRGNANFHLRHLARLTTRADQMLAWRQAILNLAIRGQLVSQDPNDEPASRLLKRIQVEKARLVQEGKIGREKPRTAGSPFVRDYLGASAVGATMQNLNQSILLDLVIALPPLPEQCRIVAKVDELMALCDQLEAELTTAQTESHRLLEAVLNEALAV